MKRNRHMSQSEIFSVDLSLTHQLAVTLSFILVNGNKVLVVSRRSSSTFHPLNAPNQEFPIFSARCNIYISRLCYNVSVRLFVRLSVTFVHCGHRVQFIPARYLCMLGYVTGMLHYNCVRACVSVRSTRRTTHARFTDVFIRRPSSV